MSGTGPNELFTMPNRFTKKRVFVGKYNLPNSGADMYTYEKDSQFGDF